MKRSLVVGALLVALAGNAAAADRAEQLSSAAETVLKDKRVAERLAVVAALGDCDMEGIADQLQTQTLRLAATPIAKAVESEDEISAASGMLIDQGNAFMKGYRLGLMMATGYTGNQQDSVKRALCDYHVKRANQLLLEKVPD